MWTGRAANVTKVYGYFILKYVVSRTGDKPWIARRRCHDFRHRIRSSRVGVAGTANRRAATASGEWELPGNSGVKPWDPADRSTIPTIDPTETPPLSSTSAARGALGCRGRCHYRRVGDNPPVVVREVADAILLVSSVIGVCAPSQPSHTPSQFVRTEHRPQ